MESKSDKKKSSTSGSNHQKGSFVKNLTARQSSMTSEDTSGLEEETQDPNTEVSPRQLERPITTSTPPAWLREVIQMQMENLKEDLGVYSSFSLSPGRYQTLNVFYVEGTPSQFWLNIDTLALTEFNSLIKVQFFSLFFSVQLINCS